MTARELLKKMTDEREKVRAQINSLKEQKKSAILNDDDDHTYFSICYELSDTESYYEQLVIAIDIVEDFMKERT